MYSTLKCSFFYFFLSVARLPFKRLNPEPKENQLPKRPCAHACPEPEDSDRQNEDKSSPLSVCSGPPLVNGRGPLDGFLNRRHPTPSDENMVIDLTENTTSRAKCPVSPAPATQFPPTKDKHPCKDKTASSEKSTNVDDTPKRHTVDCIVAVSDDDDDDDEEEEDMEDEDQTASVLQLDTTQDSDSEPEEQNESGNVSSVGNRSMQSASTDSSTSESSPEKSSDPTPTTTPTVCTTTHYHRLIVLSNPELRNIYHILL